MGFPSLVRRTARASWRRYHRKERPVTTDRVRGLWRPQLQRPIFIVGSPRSGTTFLGDCIAVLPEVSYHFEPVATKFAARMVYEGTWSYDQARAFYRSVYRWLMRIHLDGDLRFAEKTPRNCFLVGFLARAFPDASFIHIIRDGRDVALSYSKKPWLQEAHLRSGKTEPGGYPFGAVARFWVEPDRVDEFESTTDIHRCIWAWRRYVECAQHDLALLPPSRHHMLRYEELTAVPDVEATRLLDFLGITSEVSRERFFRAVENVHAESIGNWKHELSDDALERIYREAGPLLHALDYA